MATFYEIFISLCARAGKSPGAVAESIGLSRASAAGWKKGKLPRDTTIAKIAQYFDVPVSVFHEDGKQREVLEIEKNMQGARDRGDEVEYARLASYLELLNEQQEDARFINTFFMPKKETPVPMNERQAYWAERINALSPPDQVLVGAVLDGFRDNPEAMRAALGLALRAAMPSVPVP